MVELAANMATKASHSASCFGPSWLAGMMWVVMVLVSESFQALVAGSCSMMRMTPISSERPAFLYQAAWAATACRNLSIMPGLMSETRTMFTCPEHGSGASAAAGGVCAVAGVGHRAGVKDAVHTARE